MVEICFTANKAITDTVVLGNIGNLVELFVDLHYMGDRQSRGGRVDLHPSPTANDFFDVLGDRCEEFAKFIKLKRSAVDEQMIVDWCRMRKARDGDKSMIPDIMTNEGSLKEFYEIKSGSDSGKSDGRRKIRNFEELDAAWQLQYVAGTIYSPNIREIVWNATWLGSPAKIYLVVELQQAGLITYKFCVEVNAQSVNEFAIKTMFRIVIVACLLSILKIPVLIGAAARLLIQALRSPLLGSVGPDKPNHKNDTRYVQVLLNTWNYSMGKNLLAADGIFGNKTGDNIVAFQQNVTGVVDGVIDPGKASIQALETIQIESCLGGMSPEFLEENNRRQWIDDATMASLLASPGNEDPEPQRVPADGEQDMIASLQQLTQEYFNSLHDDNFEMRA